MFAAAGGQARLIVVYQRDDVAAGNVAMIHDREAGSVEIEANRGDLSARNGGSDRAAVEQAGERQVVDVAGLAGDLRRALLAKNVAADGREPARRAVRHRAALYGLRRRRGRFHAAGAENDSR